RKRSARPAASNVVASEMAAIVAIAAKVACRAIIAVMAVGVCMESFPPNGRIAAPHDGGVTVGSGMCYKKAHVFGRRRSAHLHVRRGRQLGERPVAHR